MPSSSFARPTHLLTAAVLALGGCRMTVATELEPSSREGGSETPDPGKDDIVEASGGCVEGTDDPMACLSSHTMSQTVQADVLFVVDTSEGMAPFLDELGDFAYDLGDEIAGPASDVHVGVVSMEATGALFRHANRSYVAAGSEDGAVRVTEWLRTAIGRLPVAQDRARGRDSVVALLLDSVEVHVDPQEDGAPRAGSVDTGAAVVEADQAAPEGGEGPWGPTGAFRRDGWPLTLVFVSRADDASLTAIDSFHRALDLTVDAESRTAHALVGFGGRCDQGMVGDGIEYRALAEETGGLVHDLCRLRGDDLRAIGASIVDKGLDRVHRLPSDMDLGRPWRLQAERPDGSKVDFAPTDTSIEGDLLYVHAPPPPGSLLTLSYERKQAKR